jgi:hypothetical protein
MRFELRVPHSRILISDLSLCTDVIENEVDHMHEIVSQKLIDAYEA